ncbi:MAG: hypothetical protein HY840_06535 [Bacteroidetes bacterium]|nr:hypothetical protein [Bacteroidota bacterium]
MNRLFTIIAVFAYVSCIAAQAPDKKKAKFTVHISEDKGNIDAEVLYKTKGLAAAKENKMYYWYSPNQIMETKGGYSGRLLHGNYSSFYGNNNLKEKGQFSKGLKSGKWTKWYDNGKLMEITNWKGSEKNGKYKLYNDQGEIVLEARFKNDKLSGKSTSYHLGKVLDVKRYKDGNEVPPKPEKVKKEKSPKEKPQKDKVQTEKKSFKERISGFWKKIFKKKEKDKTPVKQKENKNPARS